MEENNPSSALRSRTESSLIQEALDNNVQIDWRPPPGFEPGLQAPQACTTIGWYLYATRLREDSSLRYGGHYPSAQPSLFYSYQYENFKYFGFSSRRHQDKVFNMIPLGVRYALSNYGSLLIALNSLSTNPYPHVM